MVKKARSLKYNVESIRKIKFESCLMMMPIKVYKSDVLVIKVGKAIVTSIDANKYMKVDRRNRSQWIKLDMQFQ